MFKDLLGKAKKAINETDLKSVESYTKSARKKFQNEMKKHGVDKVVDKVKNEASIVSRAVSEAAEDVYKENKETLEKPVGTVSGVLDKVSKHKKELKWAGGIAAAFIMPVTTAVAGAAIFLFSEDEDDLTEEQKKEKAEVEKELKGTNILSTKTSLVELIYDKSSNEVYGKILSGNQKDRSFDEIGLGNMMELREQLDMENKDHKETAKLITGWINWKNKNSK